MTWMPQRVAPSRGARVSLQTTEPHGVSPLPAGGPVPSGSDGAALPSLGQVLLLLLNRPLALLMRRATSVTPDGSSSTQQLPLGQHSPLKQGGGGVKQHAHHRDRTLLFATRHPLVLLLAGALTLVAAAMLTGAVQVRSARAWACNLSATAGHLQLFPAYAAPFSTPNKH